MDVSQIARLDLLGAIVAYVIYLSSILVFTLRLTFEAPPGSGAGIPIILMAFPLAYLLFTGPAAGRPPLYYIQVGLMLAFIVALFVLDYYPGCEFRDKLPAVIGFVMLYFGGIGGMIGVASLAGRTWGIGAIALFLVAGLLAFVSRWATGL
jgi:hypothetical protein